MSWSSQAANTNLLPEVVSMKMDTPSEPWETVEYDLTADIPYGYLLRALIELYDKALCVFASYIPFLAKSRLISRWARDHNKEAHLILDFLPPGDHTSLKRDLSRYAFSYARIRYAFTIGINLSAYIIVGGIAALMVALKISDSNQGAILFILLAYTALVAIIEKISKRRPWKLCVLFAAASLAVAFIWAPISFSRSSHFVSDGSGWQFDTWALAGVATYMLIGYVFLMASVRQYLTRKYLRIAPDALTIRNLISVLEHLNSHGRAVELTEKALAIQHLEQAAVCIEIGMPRAFAIPRKPASQEVVDKCLGAAAEMRQLQAAVALAVNEPMANVRPRLTHIIEIIASGSLSKLPVADVVAKAHFKRIRILGESIKLCIVASIPGALIVGLRYINVRFPPGLYSWAVAGAIVWAAITLISMLDPLYATRLKAIAEAASIVRGRSG
jgi:hypothetical protein